MPIWIFVSQFFSPWGPEKKSSYDNMCHTETRCASSHAKGGGCSDRQVSSPNSKKTQCSVHANFIMCSEKVVCDDAWQKGNLKNLSLRGGCMLAKCKQARASQSHWKFHTHSTKMKAECLGTLVVPFAPSPDPHRFAIWCITCGFQHQCSTM